MSLTLTRKPEMKEKERLREAKDRQGVLTAMGMNYTLGHILSQ